MTYCSGVLDSGYPLGLAAVAPAWSDSTANFNVSADGKAAVDDVDLVIGHAEAAKKALGLRPRLASNGRRVSFGVEFVPLLGLPYDQRGVPAEDVAGGCGADVREFTALHYGVPPGRLGDQR